MLVKIVTKVQLDAKYEKVASDTDRIKPLEIVTGETIKEQILADLLVYLCLPFEKILLFI